MKRVSILAVLTAMFLSIGGAAVLAAPGGTPGKPAADSTHDNACPPASPNADNENPPNCGNGGDHANNGHNGDGHDNNGHNGDDNGNGNGNGNGDDNGGNGNQCPPNSPNAGGTPPNCGHPAACNDGIDNDQDGKIDADDPGCANTGDDDESDDPAKAQCADGQDNDQDGKVDADDPGCANADDNDESDDPTTDANPCAADGLSGATIAKQAYDGGLSNIPIFKDPHAAGPLSAPLDENLAPLNPVGHEVACAVSLIDENAS